jgi:hypothetical protein
VCISFSFKWLLLSSVITINDEILKTDITCIDEINYVGLLTEFVNIAVCALATPHITRHGTFIANKSEK